MSKRNKKKISVTSRMRRNQPKMDLQSLPLDALVKIFNYIPEPSKYSVLCKKFNEAICYLPNSQRHAEIDDYCILLTPEFLDHLDHHFGQVNVTCEKVDEFVIQAGKYIQNLIVSPNSYQPHLTPTNVNNILRYTPNCTELYFYNRSEETDGMLPIEEFKVKLPNLKRLDMVVYNIRDVIFAEKILHQHDLEHFSCKFDTKNEEIISQVFNLLLTTKKEIKEVKLEGVDCCFGYYFRLYGLSSLHLDICCDTEDFFCDGIEKLKSLKKLTLTLKEKCENPSILSSSKLTNLEYFELTCRTTPGIFENLSAPVLNMKVLKIKGNCIQEAKHLEKILKTFKQLEELMIDCWYNDKAKDLNFDNFDWQGCYNSKMKVLDIDIPNKFISNLINILKAIYPNLTSLRVNRTYFIGSDAQKEDSWQFQEYLNNWVGFRNVLSFYLKMGSKINTLHTTDRKFTKLTIRNKTTELTPERLQHVLKFLDRQGKNIKELDMYATKLTCEVFWQLIAPLTNCRKINFTIDFGRTADYVENESAITSIASSKVEQIITHLSSFNYHLKTKIMNKFMNLHPNLKKVSLQNEYLKEIKSDYYANFLSNCNLEYLTWHMYRTFDDYEDSEDDGNDEDAENVVGRLTEEKQTITTIICRQKKLKILKVQFVIWDEIFVEIANNCIEVEEFEFYGAEELTPESFFAIQNLRKLRKLSFGHDIREYKRNGDGSKDFTKLSSFLIGIRNLNLTTLNLFQLCGVTQENFIELATLMPSLNSLKIEITDYFECHPCLILQLFPYLEEFTINIRDRIHDMRRDYNLNMNKNLKKFSNTNLESVLTINDISNILKANPNLEQLYINTFIYENPYGNPEEVTVDELYRILKVGEKLKTIFISDLKISDPENIEDCLLKRRFELFDYKIKKIRFYKKKTCYEIILSLDDASAEKMLQDNSDEFTNEDFE